MVDWKIEHVDQGGSREQEAEYLIGEFNKLCSWRQTRLVLVIAVFSLLFSAYAVCSPVLLTLLPKEILAVAAIALMLVVGCSVIYFYRYLREQDNLLCRLDVYRHLYRCFPEEWDLRTLRHSQDDVRKHLDKAKIPRYAEERPTHARATEGAPS